MNTNKQRMKLWSEAAIFKNTDEADKLLIEFDKRFGEIKIDPSKVIKSKHGKEESKEELYYCFSHGDLVGDKLPIVFTVKEIKKQNMNYYANFYPVDYVNDMIKQGKRYSDFDTSNKLKI